MEARDCKSREWFAGKLEMLREIEQIEVEYHRLFDRKKLEAKDGQR